MRLFSNPLSSLGLQMPHALELITGKVTAPGAALTALTMGAGNSATVRNAALTSQIALLSTWAFNNAAGIWRIRSPKLHDNVQGIRNRITALDPIPEWPPVPWQKLVAQDNLTLELSGSAVGGQIEQAQLLIYYSDLPGNAARLIGVQELQQRMVNYWTTEVAIAPGATGGFSGQVAINSTFDNFKANTDYAVLGYTVDAACAAIGITSPDFSNLRVGGPGNVTSRQITARWFIELTQKFGIPLIPVFNAANKAGTLVDVAQNQAGAAVNVTIILAELSGTGGGTAAGTLS